MDKDEIKEVLTEMIEDQQQVFAANAEMIAILKTITTNTEAIKQQKSSVDYIIKYKYYSKPIIYLTAFFLLSSLLLSILYYTKVKEANSYKKTDLVFRYVQLHSKGNLEPLLKAANSLYLADPDSLFNSVELSEKERKDLLFKAGEKKKSFTPRTNPAKTRKH